jgi:translation elongation factor EF-Tu-like GTPase
MSTDPAFEKRVEDIFLIRGRGMIVVGSIKSGVLKVGDTITIRGQGRRTDWGAAGRNNRK